MSLRILPFLCLMFLLIALTVSAGEPPVTPFIRINTEMHSAQIRDIAADADGRMLATASYDKSVKIWQAGSGRLIQTLRPPVGVGVEGALNAVALSPDGAIAAAAGHTGYLWDKTYCVYLFDVASGEMIRRVVGFQKSVQRLAFSPDGKRLAVGLNNSGGVFLVAVNSGARLSGGEDLAGNCFAMDFDKAGNLVVATDEGNIRMYRADGSVAYSLKSSEGKIIYSIKFSPDGRLVAVGYEDRSSVEVRNSSDGSIAFALQESRGFYWSVAWSADGQYIMAAGGKQAADARKVLLKWSVKWKILDEQISLPSKSGITQLLALKNGDVAYVSRQSGFGVLGSGNRSFFAGIATADFQKNHDSFKISADAASVLFSYERYGQAKALFDLKKRKLTSGEPAESDMLPPRLTGNGVDVRNWENSSQPRLNNKKIYDLTGREKSWSLAVMRDDSGFILGTNHYLRSYSKKGKLLWKRRVPQVPWDVTVSADNSKVAVSHDDGTIRWYRVKDGKELYSLYLHTDRKRWILWTPEGYFDHAPASDGLVGFLVNRGAEKSSVMVGIDQMYDIFYRPDIIDRAIAGEDISAYLDRMAARAKSAAIPEKQTDRATPAKEQPAAATAPQTAAVSLPDDDEPDPAVEPAAEAALSKVPEPTLAGLINSGKLPPKVRFISKAGSSGTRDFAMKAELCDNGGGIGNVTLFINDTPISFDRGDRGLGIQNKALPQPCLNLERIITLAPGRNVISVMAFNGDNSIESDRDQVTLDYVSGDAERPRLHVLTVAVNGYRDGDLRLKYSVNDAEGVIAQVTEKGKTLFSGIEVYRLHDDQVTRDKLGAIFSQIGARTKRGDVFLLFMAGHGITDDTDGMYYFLPVDFRYIGQESIARNGISMNDFKRYLTGIQAMKTLLLIDTCNSGSFSEAVASRGVTDKTAITKLARAVGRATIAASSRNQVALEGYEGHGVFSHTLLEGMKGRAAGSNGEITINRLATFIEETLPELTYKKWGYEQIPQKTLIGSDFPIGIK